MKNPKPPSVHVRDRNALREKKQKGPEAENIFPDQPRKGELQGGAAAGSDSTAEEAVSFIETDEGMQRELYSRRQTREQADPDFFQALYRDDAAGRTLRSVVNDVDRGVIERTGREDKQFNDSLQEKMKRGIVTPQQVFSAVIEGIHRWPEREQSSPILKGKER